MAATAETPLLFGRGALADRDLRAGNVCLVVGTSSIACKSYGITRRVYEAYPYGDIVKTRQRYYNLERALPEDRSSVGTCELRSDPNFPYNDRPSVASLITQFNYGGAYDDDDEGNPARKMAVVSKDLHFVNGLKADTIDARIANFKRCIRELKEKAIMKENEKITSYAVQAGIGRGGRIDKVWLESYLPVLKDLSVFLNQYGIKCAVFVDEKYFMADELKLLNPIQRDVQPEAHMPTGSYVDYV